MRSKLVLGVLACVFALATVAAQAQQAAAPASTPAVATTTAAPADPASRTTVEGRLYIQWVKALSNAPVDEGGHDNSFQLQRAYITAKHQFDQIWSAVITLDAGNDNEYEVGTNDSRYNVFVKNAYLQGKFGLGFGTLTMQFGMIGTSAIGLIDKVSDYRWLNSNYLDAAKVILAKSSTSLGRSIDSSADMGVGAQLALLNGMVTIDAQITNGEGYKKTNEATSGDDGKAYLGMLTVRPIEGLYLAGYYKVHYTNEDSEGDDYTSYYGGTVAYSTGLVKVGVSYIMATKSTWAAATDTTTEDEYSILDAFVFANLNSVVGMPILLAGRFAMGHTELDAGEEVDTTLYAVGLGYEFTRGVRMMAYYEVLNSESDVAGNADFTDDQQRFYIKCEAKF
jgi:hypothetical protein